MSKKLLISILFLLPIMFSVSARELYVDYLDGYMEVKVGNTWKYVDIGDELSDSALIRLSDNGYVELLSGDIKITLDKDGIYEARYLLDHIKTADKWGLKGSAFVKLLYDDEIESRQSAVMGVRGDPQDEEKITWVDDDVEFLEEGKSLYQAGKFHEALAIFKEGAEWYGANFEEILFYKALSEYETGNYRQMRSSLNEMDPDPKAEFFGDYVLLKGNTLIESQNYKEAEELFSSYLSDSILMDKQQIIYLMSAFCSIELNDEDSALRKLNKAVSLDPYSETAKKASQILSSF